MREHIDLLDRYGNLWEARARVAEKVKALRAVRSEIKSLMLDAREIARRVDRLTFVVDEISQAHLKIGEDEKLEQERTLLGNAELRANLADHAYRALYGEGEDEKGAIDLFNQALQAITGLGKYDPAVKELCEQAESAAAQADDLAHTLRSYRDAVDHDPKRLAKVDERLDAIHSLKRKYGDSIKEVMAFGENAAAELAGISHSEQRIEELRTQEQGLLRAIGSLAVELSHARQAAGERMSKEIEAQLQDLGMPKARFGTALEHSEDSDGVEVDGRRLAADTTGIDRVEFLVAPNPGEPLKPLAKIASGGETSRLMLALKSVLSMADNTPTLIFDEIDQGIGGRTGGIVGHKLWALTPAAHAPGNTSSHQVICVTHLPQIAAYGDAHFHIHKEIVGDRTLTRISELGANERVDEMAQMLGNATATTRQSASEMLSETERLKGASRAHKTGTKSK